MPAIQELEEIIHEPEHRDREARTNTERQYYWTPEEKEASVREAYMPSTDTSWWPEQE